MSSLVASQPQRSLADYLAILRRRKWVVLIPLLLVPAAAYFYSAQQPKLYGATAEVLLSRQDLASSLAGNTNADVFTDADRFAETQAVLARVPEVARRALGRAEVSDLTADGLLATSTVQVRGNSDLLQFVVDHPDRRTATTLAAEYARAFSRFRLELDTANLATARLDLQKSLDVLRRKRADGTALYRELSTKALELRTLELLQREPKVVRVPTDAQQVAPDPRRSATLGIVLGLLLGLGAALLWETLDRRIRDEDEIHDVLEIPLLGRLPSPQQRDGSTRLAMAEEGGDAEADAIRRFQSNLEFANLDHDHKVILVTSALSGEGKSVTAANLALAMARAGRRVVLVDLDLRKPAVGRLLGMGFTPGVTDVAIERVTIDQALIPIDLSRPSQMRFAGRARARVRDSDDEAARGAGAHPIGSLRVLPAGFLPANPGELVGTQAIANVLVNLRQEADFVLVDAPPLLAVSDAVSLSRLADAILLIVRLGMADRPMLRELNRQLRAVPARKLGFVLTGVDETERFSSYGYGYASDQAAPEHIGRDVAPVGEPAPLETVELRPGLRG